MENVATKQSAIEIMAAEFVNLLERGIVPWDSSWADSGIPANLLTKRPYRAINLLLLGAYEYSSNYFLTEDQLARLGGQVYRGQQAHVLVDGIGFRSLRPYEVYNVSQCGNLPKGIVLENHPKQNPIAIYKEIIEQMSCCPKLLHDSEKGSYDIREDVIHMPPMAHIDSPDEYFAQFFRQLVSATKHPSRLGREDSIEPAMTPMSSDRLEELIVEIGAWYLRSFTGLRVKTPLHGHGYASFWIDFVIRNPFVAHIGCLHAQEAVEFILGTPFDEKEALDYVADEMLPF